jgi:glycosyltransferase involved in cell wall biosynthesis
MRQVRPAGAAAGPVALEIVIPACNEAKRLPASLSVLSAKVATLPMRIAVLVVDNASTDATAQIAAGWHSAAMPVRLVRCARRGKGAAVRAGLLATRAPFVGFCDADMATDLSALDSAIRLLIGGCPVVVGSRGHAGSVVQVRHSPVRAGGAAIFRTIARLIVPGASDTQCGFKFFAGPLARAAAASMVSTGFAFDIELLALCRRLGADLSEIPVCWRDMPGSTFSVPRHALGLLADIPLIWLRLRLRLRLGHAGPVRRRRRGAAAAVTSVNQARRAAHVGAGG